jgi:glucosamine--fructose-6-phosphate aminotransferase (isomerizing)
MCGIVGILSNKECVKILLDGLIQLQNRGYDSAGICTITHDKFLIHKYASHNNINALASLNSISHIHKNSHIGIGHTRWATHGAKTDANSHPHMSSDGKIVLVHNGIIENYDILKKMLISNNYTFKSETDSEVVSNLIAFMYKKTKNIFTAIQMATEQLEGTWGLAIMCIDNPNELYCTKNGSPILIGQTDNYVMIASEQSGFTKEIEDYIVLKNNDICLIKKENDMISIETRHSYKSKKVTNHIECTTPNPYPHWTIKEIYSQVESSQRAISYGGRLLSLEEVKLGGLDTMKVELMKIDNLILLGCGTSYNAGMLGMYYFKDLCNFNCVLLFDGADFDICDVPKFGKTGLVLLSQSGETKDLHRCIKIAKTHELITIGVINVVDSLIAREVDCGVYLNAGREVAVASTKSFTSQCLILSMIAIWFSQNKRANLQKRLRYIKDLYNFKTHIEEILNGLEKKIEDILHLFDNQNSCFLLGKGKCEAIAREGSLKIKEISYIHSESYSSSSLKHGPFALLCDKFPVILIAPNDFNYSKNENAFHEIKTRCASILFITNNKHNVNNKDNFIIIPDNESYADLLSVIPLQMLAYKLSISKGINPDMPKNLAKVVTVE